MTKNRSGILASALYCIACLTATAPAHAQAGTTATAEQEGKAPATTFSAVYKLDLLSTQGGGDSDAGGMGNLDLMLRADLDQALGWQNTIAYLHVLANHGAKINGNHTGSLMGTSNIEVPTDTAKLFHAWLQHSYLDDRLSLLAGLYPIDSEFSVMESAGLFLHPAYGPPADLSLTRGPSIFNTSAFGVRVRWNGIERDRYAMAALLDGIPGDPAKPHGTHIRFDAGDGAFAIAELGFTPPERGHVMEPTDPSSPRTQGDDIRLHEKYESFGKYAFGVWGYSERVDDLVDRVGGNPVQRRSRGAYLLAEKTLYRMPGSPVRHLAGFARLSRTDGDSTAIDQTINIGLRLRAPFNTREDDIVGIAFTHGRLGDKYRQAQAAIGAATASAESALEATYRYQANDWLALQPMLQYIRHPGGDPALSNVKVVGVRIEIGTP
jgi:porin